MGTFSREQARAFYDRLGAKQDTQGYYEDPATRRLIEHAAFDQAESLLEFGCGTGRFADQLLAQVAPPSARYHGYDQSTTMVGLARERLAEYGDRATVTESAGEMIFEESDGSVDRVISNYVLDLLEEEDIHAFLAEANRVLAENGRLCLVSLTYGNTAISRLVSGMWSAVRSIRPVIVGGCRPIRLADYLDPDQWDLLHDDTVIAYGIPSEVLLARPRSGRTFGDPPV